MKFITIYVTHKNLGEAKKISNLLLEKKMIACVNYFPVTVSYHWKDDIADDDECVSLLKTRIENWECVQKEILSLHPYEVPCIMKNEVEANDEYVAWILKETHLQ